MGAAGTSVLRPRVLDPRQGFTQFIRLNVVVVVVSHIQRIGCQPEKTTLHGGQSRSWSAEQGKNEKMKKSGSATRSPVRAAHSEKENKNHATHLHA